MRLTHRNPLSVRLLARASDRPLCASVGAYSPGRGTSHERGAVTGPTTARGARSGRFRPAAPTPRHALGRPRRAGAWLWAAVVTFIYTALSFGLFRHTWADPSHRLIGWCCDSASSVSMLRVTASSVVHLRDPLLGNYLATPHGFNLMWQPAGVPLAGVVATPTGAALRRRHHLQPARHAGHRRLGVHVLRGASPVGGRSGGARRRRPALRVLAVHGGPFAGPSQFHVGFRPTLVHVGAQRSRDGPEVRTRRRGRPRAPGRPHELLLGQELLVGTTIFAVVVLAVLALSRPSEVRARLPALGDRPGRRRRRVRRGGRRAVGRASPRPGRLHGLLRPAEHDRHRPGQRRAPHRDHADRPTGSLGRERLGMGGLRDDGVRRAAAARRLARSSPSSGGGAWRSVAPSWARSRLRALVGSLPARGGRRPPHPHAVGARGAPPGPAEHPPRPLRPVHVPRPGSGSGRGGGRAAPGASVVDAGGPGGHRGGPRAAGAAAVLPDHGGVGPRLLRRRRPGHRAGEHGVRRPRAPGPARRHRAGAVAGGHRRPVQDGGRVRAAARAERTRTGDHRRGPERPHGAIWTSWRWAGRTRRCGRARPSSCTPS